MNEPLRTFTGLLIAAALTLCAFMVLSLVAPAAWGQCDPFGLADSTAVLTWGAGSVYVDSFTTPACGGTLDSLRCKITNANNGDDGFQLVIYDDNSGKPGNLIDSTAIDSIKSATSQVFTLPVQQNASIAASTVYWIGAFCNSPTTMGHENNNGAGGNTVEWKGSQSQIPLTWGTSTGSDGTYAIYLIAYYTETAAASAPKRKRKN